MAKAGSISAPRLSWLSEICDFGPSLQELQPIWVHHSVADFRHALPPPHSHPYCEFSLLLKGSVVQFVEGEEAERCPGDLFLAGPGIPHWATIVRHPFECLVVYFQPWIFVELGKDPTGSQIIRRFTARQALNERLVRPPLTIRRDLATRLKEMVAEFGRKDFGWDLRLHALLTEILVRFLRWEKKTGYEVKGLDTPIDWRTIERALQYLRAHFAEPVYGSQVAAAAGLSRSRLQSLFQSAMGMPWVKYLQGYRIHRAALMLQGQRTGVSEAAFAAGFESLSHFNATFRQYLGMSPTEYAGRHHLSSWKNRKSSG